MDERTDGMGWLPNIRSEREGGRGGEGAKVFPFLFILFSFRGKVEKEEEA